MADWSGLEDMAVAGYVDICLKSQLQERTQELEDMARQFKGP